MSTMFEIGNFVNARKIYHARSQPRGSLQAL
jgi:hypothetical protein